MSGVFRHAARWYNACWGSGMTNPHRTQKAACAIALALGTSSLPITTHAQSAIIYGALGNFDIANDTGKTCHGFEVELDGVTPAQVPYGFSANRYGVPTVTATASGTLVRWESPYNASARAFVERTLPHRASWFPGQCYPWNPGTYEASGCEHFGTGATANPTRVTSHWLCEDPAQPGVLIAHLPDTAVPFANYYVQPPVRANEPAVLVAEVEAPEPAEAPELYGDAQWMRVFKLELKRTLSLDELMADNPGVVPMDLAQLESDWQVIQAEPVSGGPGNRKRKRNAGNIAPETQAVVRRIELYGYRGEYDAVTHEALCADGLCKAPAAGERGELISVQMTAANVQPDSVVLTLSGNGRVDSADKLLSCGSKCAQSYAAGTQVTLTAKAASGSMFSGWTGACTGTSATCSVSANGIVRASATFAIKPATGGGGGGKR
jgi:hypothetical protein